MNLFLGAKDQAMVLAKEAVNQEAVIQVLWSYSRPIRVRQIIEFHKKLSAGPLSRQIAKRSLPIGRYYWRWKNGPANNLTISRNTLSHSQMTAWMDSEVERPLDPFVGPGWRLSYQTFDNGKSIAALTISHCIADGAETVRAIELAATGRHVKLQSWETPRESSLVEELSQILKDCKASVQTLPSLAVLGMHSICNVIGRFKMRERSSTYPALKGVVREMQNDSATRMATCSASIPLGNWQRACQRTKSTSLSLVVKIIGSIAIKEQRTKDDHLSLIIPMGMRTQESKDIANNVRLAKVVLPCHLFIGNELLGLRKQLNAALIRARRERSVYETVLPVVPLIPKRLFGRLYYLVTKQATALPISVSHMGMLPDTLLSIDGLPADDICCRGIDRLPKTNDLMRRGGVLTIISAEVNGHMMLNFTSQQIGRNNGQQTLQGQVLETLTKLQLTCTIFPREAGAQTNPES